MLVLARKEGESSLIGKDIRVTVVRSRTGEVRLGVDAPIDVPVLRHQLEEKDSGREETTPVTDTA